MKILLTVLMVISFPTFASWEDVTPSPLNIKGNSSYFNATILETLIGTYEIESHTNPSCELSTESRCRKGLLSYARNKYDESKIRRHSFTFTLNSMEESPDHLIIYQDWVRVHQDDSNGNPPITTLKIKRVNGKLFLQHWDNSWLWEYDPNDYDQHLVTGMETMNGEVEIQKGLCYNIEIYTQDFSGSGRTFVSVNNTIISDSIYKASHLSEPHIVMTGMYWSKGFNKNLNPQNNIKATYSNITHEVLRL